MAAQCRLNVGLDRGPTRGLDTMNRADFQQIRAGIKSEFKMALC
jgi:hypothetical protein